MLKPIKSWLKVSMVDCTAGRIRKFTAHIGLTKSLDVDFLWFSHSSDAASRQRLDQAFN